MWLENVHLLHQLLPSLLTLAERQEQFPDLSSNEVFQHIVQGVVVHSLIPITLLEFVDLVEAVQSQVPWLALVVMLLDVFLDALDGLPVLLDDGLVVSLGGIPIVNHLLWEDFEQLVVELRVNLPKFLEVTHLLWVQKGAGSQLHLGEQLPIVDLAIRQLMVV